MVKVALGLLLASSSLVDATGVQVQSRVNPIRKVVNMLQMMQNKVIAEGKKKEELYDKFMCYCQNADDLLGGEIAAAKTKIPQLESTIKEDAAMKKQLESDLKAHKSDRAAAKEALAKADAIRERESTEYAKESGDLSTNLAALAKAIPAIEKGMSGFLQTTSASVLRELSVSMDMSSVDRDMLASFLSSKTGYAPQSGEIVGILKQMQDEMQKNLDDATAAEQDSIKEYDGLVAAKSKEITSLTKAIESKTSRVGEIAVKLAETENDLEDTKEDLAESEKFLADLDSNCETKKKEWAVFEKMQSEELLALADTVKILNDDDALELFKKTLPGAGASSFLQVQVTAKESMHAALEALQSHRKGKDPRVDLLEVALRGGKGGFAQMTKMIDDLVGVLKKEQGDDEKKKEYCEAEFDKNEDEKKGLDNDIADVNTAIDDAEESVATLKSELKALGEGIAGLDKEVGDATETRKEENQDWTQTSAANNAAVEVLKFAKNRLNKFYNPKLHKAAPKRELSEEDQITVNMGGTLAPTAAPGGIAGTGISFVQTKRSDSSAVPPPPPAADMAYKSKGEESAGVIQMMDTLIADVEKENQELKLTEDDAQGDYEKFMEDASAKRAEDSKSITDKEASLADTENELLANQETLKDKKTDLMENGKYGAGLHAECDWLLKYFDMRKEARTGEIDALGKAKDVLNGADYS